MQLWSHHLRDIGEVNEDQRVALKIMEQLPFEERLKGLKLFSLYMRRLMGRSMVEVYKVMKAVAKVNVYFYSPNATPLETRTLKEVCRFKMDALLPYLAFGELPEHFVIGSNEGRQQLKVQKGLNKFLENRSIN